MKHKWLVAILSLVMSLVLGCAAVACNETGENPEGGESHTHTYDAWDHDDTQHWKYCDEHGSDKSNIDESTRANHDFTNGDCECGAKKPEPSHTHAYTKWEHDANQHWKVCPDDGAVDPAGKTNHDFSNGDCECGAKKPAEGHTHSFTQWEKDENQHWKVCPDDGEMDPAGKSNHDFSNGDCECGQKKPVEEHTHTYDAWDHDDTQHWKYCDEHGDDKSNIDESTRADHDFSNGNCECGAEKPVTPVELDTREFYVVGGGAGDLKTGTWNGPDEKFKFTKAEEADKDGYTVYTFRLKVYSDDEFKFIEKNAITQGTDDDGNPTYTWNDALVYTFADLDANAAKGIFKDVGGNMVVEANADGVYEFTIRTQKGADMHAQKVSFKLVEKVDPLGVRAQYDMYIVGKVAAKTGCKWPSEYPAKTLVEDVAKYCYHLELQDDNETFSVLANLRTTDTFKVWNAKLGNKDAGYYPTGMGGDLSVKANGWYVVSWKAGATSVSVTMHEHDYTKYEHGAQGTTQHWKVCSICGAKQEGSDEDHSYGESGTENCVCGVTPGWGDHVHTYTTWKKDVEGYLCWKVCPDDNQIDPENGKELHDFDATGTCSRCGSKLDEILKIYLSTSSALPTEAYLDSVIIGQLTKSDAAPNNPRLVLDPATKTFSITMWLTAGELWKPWAADKLATDGVYDRFNWLYRYDTTAKATRSVNYIQLGANQPSGVYTVSWVYNTASFTLTAVEGHQHDYDGDTDEVCNTCGYVRHFYKEAWTQTVTHHYHESTCEHEGLKKDYAPHDFGEDRTCDTCGYTRLVDYEFTFEASGDDAYVVSGYTFVDSAITEIEIPALHEEKPVIGIKNDAFYKESDTTFANITKVTLPASLVTLGNDAFRGFTSLKTINLEKVTTYGNYALSGTALESITLPETVTSIGTCVFYQCTALTEATLPNSITVIPEKTFGSCSLLAQVNLGNAVTELGNNVFYGTALTSFTIPETVTKLGNYIFASSKMQSFTFVGMNEAVTKTGGYMFMNCKSLTSVTLGDKITELSIATFNGCEKLTTIVIPAQVKQIYYNAFAKSGLKTVTLEGGATGWKLGKPAATAQTSVPTLTAAILVSGKSGSTSGSMSRTHFWHD